MNGNVDGVEGIRPFSGATVVVVVLGAAVVGIGTVEYVCGGR
jgi:hypothetical protein